MKPAAFDMARPETLAEALTLLAERTDDAKVIAGGQSLVPVMNFRLAAPGLLIDLNRIKTLAGIRLDGNMLRIGAMTRQSALMESPLIAHAPLLALALPHIGHVQTRSRGTIGGSLAHADPSAELPLTMVALDAALTIESRRGGCRTMPAREFFIDAMVTELAPDELLTEIAFAIAPANSRCSFRELALRHGDFAIVAVAAQFAAGDLTVAVGGLEARPRYCRCLVGALRERNFSLDDLQALISDELADVEPLSDLQSSGDYRRELAAVLVAQSLNEVLAT